MISIMKSYLYSLQHLSSFFIVIKLENSTIQYDDYFQPLIRFFHFLPFLMLLNCNKALKTELPIVSFVYFSTRMNTDGQRGKEIQDLV